VPPWWDLMNEFIPSLVVFHFSIKLMSNPVSTDPFSFPSHRSFSRRFYTHWPQVSAFSLRFEKISTIPTVKLFLSQSGPWKANGESVINSTWQGSVSEFP
jgi:hypothetical protein